MSFEAICLNPNPFTNENESEEFGGIIYLHVVNNLLVHL
jgi:hypothetical protein